VQDGEPPTRRSLPSLGRSRTRAAAAIRSGVGNSSSLSASPAPSATAVAFTVVQDDGPAVGVERFDTRRAQPHPGAVEHLGQGPLHEVLARRELVETHPLDEVGSGVDEGDLDGGPIPDRLAM